MSDDVITFKDPATKKAYDVWHAQTHPAFKVYEAGFPVAFQAGWIAASEHHAATIATLTAERDQLRQQLAAISPDDMEGVDGLTTAEADREAARQQQITIDRLTAELAAAKAVVGEMRIALHSLKERGAAAIVPNTIILMEAALAHHDASKGGA